MKETILYVDFMCMMHRAKTGFGEGEHYLQFNFFRSFRAIVEQLRPTKIYVALEGHPTKRLQIDSSYKENRKLDESDPEAENKARIFYGQVELTIELLKNYFPVTVARHPALEADDVIAFLVRKSNKDAHNIILSTDKDYLQLVSEADNVSLYDPVRKRYLTPNPDIGSFLVWRALHGDVSDCIPKIVPDMLAIQASSDMDILNEILADQEKSTRFYKNIELISFVSDVDFANVYYSTPQKDWSAVILTFTQWKFNAILKSWPKFVATFETLF